jgi:hypothetical protein
MEALEVRGIGMDVVGGGDEFEARPGDVVVLKRAGVAAGADGVAGPNNRSSVRANRDTMRLLEVNSCRRRTLSAVLEVNSCRRRTLSAVCSMTC